jgi:nucleoside 2-deoxyribosyltransferase
MSKRVYLAGPIAGLTFDDCTDWREEAKKKFALHNVVAMSPMRAKEYLQTEGVLDAKCEEYEEKYGSVLSSTRGIITQDYWDCTTGHIILANFLDAERVSIGTVAEIAWAYQSRNPVVCVMEEKGNVHDHAFINEMVGFRVSTLDEGIETVLALFNY